MREHRTFTEGTPKEENREQIIKFLKIKANI